MRLIKSYFPLIFLLISLICSIECRERNANGRRREKSSSKTSGTLVSHVPNLCEKDVDMKIGCHCTRDHSKQRIKEVDCLILHKELSQSDLSWRAFTSHNNINQISLTVTRNGYMGYLPVSLFQNQRELTSVNIRFGNIREIPARAFGEQTKLQNISLEKNEIEIINDRAFANLADLRILNLDDNQIVSIGSKAFVNLTLLVEFSASKNNLTSLPDDVFVDLMNLHTMRLSENYLNALTKDVFKGMGKLHILDLSFNNLKLLEPVFTELWSLQELYLDNNQLERISERAFDGLNNLKILNLESNKITALEGATLSGVPAVINLNLNNNKLEVLTYQNVLPIMDNLVNNTSSVLSMSDTSGSLNVCTPLSGKDFTREFTSRIHERCQIPISTLQQTTTVLDTNSGKISTILTTPTTIEISSPQSTPTKKPSYLNLACCVNGYSNLTTYDSKFRQSINKSREVSPIRPITHTVHYNRNNSTHLTVPFTTIGVNDSNNKRHSMMDTHSILSPEKRFFMQSQTSTGHDCTDNITTNGRTSFFKKTLISSTTTTSQSELCSNHVTITRDGESNSISKTSKSFIQQRVERLYGPTALEQGIYSPKKPKSASENVLVERSQHSSEFNEHTKNVALNTYASSNAILDIENIRIGDEASKGALPVLRYLRPEFRAQLPTVSPKRSVGVTINQKSPSQLNDSIDDNAMSNGDNNDETIQKPIQPECDDENSVDATIQTKANVSNVEHRNSDECDRLITVSRTNDTCNSVTETIESVDKLHLNETNEAAKSNTNNGGQNQQDETTKMIDAIAVASLPNANSKIEREIDANGNRKTDVKKDAVYFLNTVHSERDRLLRMADAAEVELDELLKRDDIDEEVLGHMRSFSGKARLLATKKFKQFEGLCNDSLNQTSGDSCAPPTIEDLQGFWDMVLLQVNNVDALSEEVDAMRTSGWKKPAQAKAKAPQGSKLTKRPITSKANPSATQASPAKKSAAAIALAQKREAQRKQFMEMKRKNKLAMATSSAPVANETEIESIVGQQNKSKNESETVFDEANVTDSTTNLADR